ncbi:hypothetical protein E2C01_033145 [Portunus trituberculatus]|uniref:Uncharacterized protein n=1 Tax=Portunus trituberculatus TaxID=210409 RepID=A0A5B7F4U7_PORTR|nr:hypothetical protein [Portunus trituberculatus]
MRSHIQTTNSSSSSGGGFILPPSTATQARRSARTDASLPSTLSVPPDTSNSSHTSGSSLLL